MPHVAIAANKDWNIVNYRAGLVRSLVEGGCAVTVIVPPGPHRAAIEALGATVAPSPLDARGTSPLADLTLLWRYRRLLRRLAPDALLGFTAKPNIWGALAARSLGIPVVANISGLGTVFAQGGPLMSVMERLYRMALKPPAIVMFQNGADRDLFVAHGIVGRDQARLLPGSGIDLDRFKPAPPRCGSGAHFLFAGRLLWAKGVRTFVEAGSQVRAGGLTPHLAILGFIEPSGRDSVPHSTLAQWDSSGQARYLGSTADVRPAIAACDAVVLPTVYGEGVPHILLEAAAMARPCIASDAPGCREAIKDGVTGFLVEPGSANSLAAAMARLAALSPAERIAMGRAGRAKMEKSFNQDLVHRAYGDALRELEVISA